jgi:hypothetical protein
MKIKIIIKRKWLINLTTGLIISAVVMLLGLLALELLVRKIKPQISYTEAVKKSSGDFRYNDFVPFSLKPNIKRGNFFTNSHGYRSDEFSIEKPDNTYRVLVLGDSFVSSMEDDNANAWPQVMQSILNTNSQKKIEVINAGFHDGYSPDAYYAYLRGEGLRLQPDLVVLGLYLQNDVGDLKTNQWPKLDEKGLPLKVVSDWRRIDSQGRQQDGFPPLRYRYSYLKESHLWILFADWIDHYIPWLFHPKDEAKRYSDLINWFYLTYSNCIFKPDCFSNFTIEFNKLLSLLKGTSELLQETNISFLIVFQPSRFQVGTMGEILPEENVFLLQKTIINYFHNNNLTAEFLDLTSDFRALNAWNYYLVYDTHWNTLGNHRAAQIVASKIQLMMK